MLLSSLATLAAFVSADMVEYALGSQFAGIDREFNWLERRCAHMQCFVETSTGAGRQRSLHPRDGFGLPWHCSGRCLPLYSDCIWSYDYPPSLRLAASTTQCRPPSSWPTTHANRMCLRPLMSVRVAKEKQLVRGASRPIAPPLRLHPILCIPSKSPSISPSPSNTYARAPSQPAR